MIFDVLKFYKDYKIRFAERGSKHCREGWVQIDCPFCHGRDFHLGCEIASGIFTCWKCKGKSQIQVIRALLHCDDVEARVILRQYKTNKRPIGSRNLKRDKEKAARCVFPAGTVSLPSRHRKYLENRNFDPDLLEKVWSLKAVEAVGPYKWRIIAPIYYHKRLMSYQGRDITDKSKAKYKACASEDEVIDHQNLVYGYDLVKGDSCVIVEGIADVWRLGPDAVCCFGTAFTLAQVNLIANRFNRVFVFFDADDDNAMAMAEQLGFLLMARGVQVEILELDEGDPGDMEQEEANKLMLELGLRGYNYNYLTTA